MIGMKDFRVAPESLKLQSFLWGAWFRLFLPFFSLFWFFFLFFFPFRVQAQMLYINASFPVEELKSYLPLKAWGNS